MRIKKPNKSSLLLARYINDWSTIYLPNIKSYKSHTIRSYRQSLKLFLSYLESIGIGQDNFSFEQLSRRNIEYWLMTVTTDGKSPKTRNNRLAGIRSFLRYLEVQDVTYRELSLNAALISLQKSVECKVTGMSKDAIKALMLAPNYNTSAGQRDLTLLSFLYGTATRIDEALSLKVNQLHLDSAKPFVTIIGKGSKIRTIPLLPKVVAYLKKYLEAFHPKTPMPDAYVFYSRSGGYKKKISHTAIDKRIKKYAAMAHCTCNDVPLSLHAHQLRHARASHWLAEGMNIVQISFLLGHAHVNTTMMYLDITSEDQIKAIQTIEDESDTNQVKKWKTDAGTLASICGL
jgi:site-specific recombinase XerD